MSDRGYPASDAYPERQERRPSAVEKIVLRLAYLPQQLLVRPLSPAKIAQIDGYAAGGGTLDSQLKALRYDLRRHGLREDLVSRALGLLGRQARAAIGRKPSRTELAAAALLVRGRRCVELADIDAWPLAAALAATTVALAGIPAHVIVVTGFIAKRDAEAMRPLIESCGLTVGMVDEDMQDADRRAAYAADVTYCVHRAVALDYLRDRMVLKGRPHALRLRTEALTSHNPRTPHLMLRGLQFAIACEAETVLVDAAQWPVSISAEANSSQEAAWLDQALRLARLLSADTDYRMDQAGALQLTEAGSARLAAAVKQMAGHWQGTKRREHIVTLALVADRMLVRDEHYAVTGENLQVGEEILRLHAPEQGAGRLLKTLLELKESCVITGTREILARIGYQRFFRRYLRSGGLVMAARGLGPELWSIYGLRVVRLPACVPALRVNLADRLFDGQAAAVAEVAARIREIHANGNPVLVVTRTPQGAVAWTESLKKAGIEGERLVGIQSAEEAAAFAAGGAKGKITVVPHYAARSTRIQAVSEIEKTGGLRVIIVQLLALPRHQQCILERAIPQGVPGSVQRMLTLEDDLMAAYVWRWWRRPARPFHGVMLRICQWRAGRDYSHTRDELFRMEDYLGDVLAFSGGQL
jgi:preprotein translocase subunit SecA